MPIRVLFVQPVLAPYSIPRYEALARSGTLEVHVALEAERFVERPGWIPKQIPNCRIHLLKSYLRSRTIEAKDRGFKETLTKAIPYGLTHTIIKLKPDVVVVCNPTEFLFALIARTSCDFLLGLILEDTLVSENRKHPAIQWLRKRLYKFTDFVFCFSNDAETYARDIAIGGTLLRSSWSINPEWLQSASRRLDDAQVRTAPEPRAPLQFLYVGALSERKGVMPLLRAWRQFSKRNADVILVLLGDGPLREAMERYCVAYGLTNVRMPGHLPYDETQEVYLNSDVFVFPTLEDIFGLVITEAMAFGLPVLTTIYTGARELVQQAENGYIFDPLDEQSFVSSLEKIAARRAELPSMGQVSRKIISAYTHREVMQRMENDIRQVYEDRLRKHRK